MLPCSTLAGLFCTGKERDRRGGLAESHAPTPRACAVSGGAASAAAREPRALPPPHFAQCGLFPGPQCRPLRRDETKTPKLPTARACISRHTDSTRCPARLTLQTARSSHPEGRWYSTAIIQQDPRCMSLAARAISSSSQPRWRARGPSECRRTYMEGMRNTKWMWGVAREGTHQARRQQTRQRDHLLRRRPAL
jgi:hypothetical protein